MNESTITADGHSSEKELVCTSSELQNLTNKYPIDTIIKVNDQFMKPYILLEDADNVKYWRPYGGESLEEVHRYHKWEIEAQKKFRDERRSSEELDQVRNVIMSFILLSEFLETDNENKCQLMVNIIDRFAIQWFATDNKLDKRRVDIKANCEKLAIYFELAQYYIASYMNTYASVQDSIDASKIDRPPQAS